MMIVIKQSEQPSTERLKENIEKLWRIIGVMDESWYLKSQAAILLTWQQSKNMTMLFSSHVKKVESFVILGLRSVYDYILSLVL